MESFNHEAGEQKTTIYQGEEISHRKCRLCGNVLLDASLDPYANQVCSKKHEALSELKNRLR